MTESVFPDLTETLNGPDDLAQYYAELAEQSERYDDMAGFMLEHIARDEGNYNQISEDERARVRNLLGVAFKNAVAGRRSSWRVISSIEQKEGEKGNADHEKMVEEFRRSVELEIRELCEKCTQLIENKILTQDGLDVPSEVFFHKMVADYSRYLAEIMEGDLKQNASQKAEDMYSKAIVAATDKFNGLHETDPLRLGLMLNYSVFHYEVLNTPDQACTWARRAFEEAVAQIDNVREDQAREAKLIIQLIRDNLMLWTTKDGEGCFQHAQQGYGGGNTGDQGQIVRPDYQ